MLTPVEKRVAVKRELCGLCSYYIQPGEAIHVFDAGDVRGTQMLCSHCARRFDGLCWRTLIERERTRDSLELWKKQAGYMIGLTVFWTLAAVFFANLASLTGIAWRIGVAAIGIAVIVAAGVAMHFMVKHDTGDVADPEHWMMAFASLGLGSALGMSLRG